MRASVARKDFGYEAVGYVDDNPRIGHVELGRRWRQVHDALDVGVRQQAGRRPSGRWKLAGGAKL